MSGEHPLIVLMSEPGSPLVDLLHGLVRIEAAGLGEHALIGGVAVMTRLAGQHRATADLDQVVAPTDPTAQVLLGAPPGTVQRVLLEGQIKVDVIEVGEIPLADYAADDLPADPPERLFLLAHDFALRSAQHVDLAVRDRTGGPVMDLVARIATPAALFAAKLQSAPRRSAVSTHKRGTDILDALLLLDRFGIAEIADGLRSGPHDLPQLVAALTEQLLETDALRSLRWVREAGQDGDRHGLSLAGVRQVAGDLRAALTNA